MREVMVGREWRLIRLTQGERFAHDFEILHRIAEGGMGTVYAVYDHAAGERRALKVLLPELITNERTRRRFTQEARVSSQIESPYVPQVFRGGIDPVTMTPYILMQLLDGEDLHHRIKRAGALPPEDVFWVIEQLTHALAAAHRAGIVHRDLKPENVFLHRDEDGEKSVKLLDFGIAKLIDADRTSATGTGAIGSPMWMAPEQTSAGGRISPSTDVWALGLLAFYILTGKMFWKAAHDDSGVTGLLREMHLDPIPPASERALAVAPGVELPEGFDAWFQVAVARDHEQRFRDAGAAMHALRASLESTRRNSSLAYANTLAFDAPDVGMASGPPDGAFAPASTAALGTLAEPQVIPTTLPPNNNLTNIQRPPEGRSSSAPATAGSAVKIPETFAPDAESPYRPPVPVGVSSRPPTLTPAPRRLSGTVWVVLLLLAGTAVAFLTGAIVWVVLTLSTP